MEERKPPLQKHTTGRALRRKESRGASAQLQYGSHASHQGPPPCTSIYTHCPSHQHTVHKPRPLPLPPTYSTQATPTAPPTNTHKPHLPITPPPACPPVQLPHHLLQFGEWHIDGPSHSVGLELKVCANVHHLVATLHQALHDLGVGLLDHGTMGYVKAPSTHHIRTVNPLRCCQLS